MRCAWFGVAGDPIGAERLSLMVLHHMLLFFATVDTEAPRPHWR